MDQPAWAVQLALSAALLRGLTAHRDFGSGVLGARPGPARAVGLLGTPFGLACACSADCCSAGLRDLVFPSRLGTPAEPRNVLREFHALVARAGLPAARFHTLRRSCGALLVAQGVHLQVIADFLGHSDIRVTSAVDAHVGEQLQRDEAERMATALDW